MGECVCVCVWMCVCVCVVDLRPLTWWDYGFEFRREHRCLSLVIVVFCQVEVFASG